VGLRRTRQRPEPDKQNGVSVEERPTRPSTKHRPAKETRIVELVVLKGDKGINGRAYNVGDVIDFEIRTRRDLSDYHYLISRGIARRKDGIEPERKPEKPGLTYTERMIAERTRKFNAEHGGGGGRYKTVARW